MTATSGPFGLQAVRKIGGAPNSVGRNTYPIKSLTTATLYKGQPVRFTSDGVVDIYASAGYTTGAATWGVFDGCRYTDPVTGRKTEYAYWPGGTSATDAEAYIIDDPFTTYFVQCNTSLTATNIGQLAGFTTASYTSGTTQWGQSLALLNQGSLATSDAAVRILGVAQLPNNAINDAYPIVEVMFANHMFLTTAGI